MKPLTLILASFAILLLAAGCETWSDPISQAGKPSIAEVQAIAEEGYIYGLPIVMNYAITYEYFVDRTASQYKSPFNEISNEHRVFTPTDTTVVTPNSDTPYSTLGLDLRAEPLVISVPAVERGRYYSVQLVDGNTFNFGYIGSRATGNAPGDYIVAGPEWQGETPPGIKKVFRSTTQLAGAIFRTQLFNPADMPNVVRVQAGYKVRPLSAYLKLPAPPPATALEFPRIDKELVKKDFFGFLDFALQLAPPGPEEKEIRAKLARLGIGVGRGFDSRALSLEHKVAVAQGMKEGDKKVDDAIVRLGTKVNGWIFNAAFGDRAFFHGDWLLRAAGAKAGIYGNDLEEAKYLLAIQDVTSQPLDGSQHRYALVFPAGALPPVNAFWSVTMYDRTTQLLIENPINRSLISSPMLPGLNRDSDGGLTLHIQRESPGKDRESNWLPAPNGPFMLVMRLYWPKPETLDGSWKQPPLVRVGTGKTTDAAATGAALATTDTRIGRLEFERGYPSQPTVKTLFD
jgi:hypothetical protein